MTAYYLLKWLHVLGATVLLGTGAGIAFFMLMAHRTGDVRAIAAVARIVVLADYRLHRHRRRRPAGDRRAARPLGRLSADRGLDPRSRSRLYLLTGAFWLPVVWMQSRMRDLAASAASSRAPLPAEYHRLFRLWFAFGFPAFTAVLAIFWLMIARPEISL